VSWAWTFGSAGAATSPSPSFRFASPGTYSVALTVTDDDGAAGSASASVDVTAAIHAALVATSTERGGGRTTPSWWKAAMTVAVHGADERPIAAATLSGAWSGGWTKAVSCVTDAAGRCTLKTSPLGIDKASVTFTVTSVSAPLSVYAATANHNNTGAGTTTSVTVIRP
jgi:serine protease AprX